MAFLEELLRRLPAERRSSPEGTSRIEVSAVWKPEEREILRRAAEALAIHLEDFLLAGFAGLLSRLTCQDTISLARLSPSPGLATFTWEEGIAFSAGLATVRTEEFSPASTSVRGGANFLFLQADSPVPVFNGSGLRLTVWEAGDHLMVALANGTGRWTESTLKSWLSSLRSLLLAAAKTPNTPLKLLPLLEESAILNAYKALNQTAGKYASEACVHDLVTQQAERNPEAVAIVFGDRQLTYRELDEQSTRRARRLVVMGAGPNRPVAICMERSEQLPVALLAVLKSGSCYVPLDPQHPRQRIALTLEECQPVAVLSDSVVAPSLEDISAPVLRMDEDWPETEAGGPPSRSVTPDDLAYIIYTSGTTGKPKGVRIMHRSLVSLFDPRSKMPELTAGDRLLAVTTISFDIATMDMLLPLSTGATLVVANRFAAGDAFELARLVEEQDITFLQATPFTWRLLVNSGWSGKRNLRMVSGGEALPRDLANELLPLGQELWNCYGPTETTIYSGSIRLKTEDGIVPLGPPIANTSFYVMDEGGKPVPLGVPGELYIGGVGVSPGYLQHPELTSQRFVPDTFSAEPGRSLFRTGDLVRMVSDRELEFMGRLDHQVKLRGYRIELAEIESVLRSHPAVENAAVILREDVPGEPRLVAYVTLSKDQLQANELKKYAARSLPEYMLPSRIVTLSTLPLTSSGKIDRRALPLPESVPGHMTNVPSATAGVAPGNELEARLLQIFREVLSQPFIGVTDSFFNHGGYSLLTAKLFARIYRALGVKLPISLLFDAPTVRELAEIMQKGEPLPIVVPIRKEGRAAPLFVIHSYLIYAALREAIEEDRPIYGVRELDDHKPIGNLEERAAMYAKEITRAYPHGPLSLAGWCLAGSLTVEVARQLRDDGRVVALVALFDSESPGYKPRIADGSSLWKAKLVSSAKFHSAHLSDLDWQDKVRYLSAHTAHWWEDAVETFSIRHRTAFRWLQRHLPLLLPAAMRDDLEGLSLRDLQPSAQQSYPGKIVLFRASDVVRLSGAEPSLGWNVVAKQGVDVEFAPGDHESMFREPHLAHFGKMLRRVLREGEAAC
ncbi:MAG TPA: amino acid adenylation domain-containing protein [Silvibacterium sp.]|nr:amino acid adenylation domain-containing protein [Silvibacterium sp.]